MAPFGDHRFFYLGAMNITTGTNRGTQAPQATHHRVATRLEPESAVGAGAIQWAPT